MDGCGAVANYAHGYPAMGAALQATGRDIVYSCSWPAYLGDDESTKPFAAFISAGCNLWRNYLDMGPTTGYLQGIISHFGNFSGTLSQWAGPGHWHDADVLLAGVDGVPLAAQQAQFAIYCVLALPLILGDDLRTAGPEARAFLLNPHALAVSGDPLGRAGVLLGAPAAAGAPTQVWVRPLASGAVAVALYNAGPPSAHPWHTPCDPFNATQGGYWAPLPGTQPAGWCLEGYGQSLMEWYCCNTADCAGYNFSAATGAGCLFKDVAGGWVAAPGASGYTKQGFAPPTGGPADIEVRFADVGLLPGAPVEVFDVWEGAVVEVVANASGWTARGVPFLGAAFLRLRQVPS